MINGAAHKPPRPSDCFACSRQVEGFEPACPNSYTSEGGPGIASVLAATLQRNDHKIRTASRRSPGPAHSRSVPGDDSEHDRMRRMSRSGRRRSSVVAAAITATLLSSSRPKSIGSQSTRSSPTALKFSVSPVKISFESAAQGQAAHDDPQILALPPAPGTPLDGTSSSSQWSEQTQGVLTPHLDWASEPMPEFDQLFPKSVFFRSSLRCSSVDSRDALVRIAAENRPVPRAPRATARMRRGRPARLSRACHRVARSGRSSGLTTFRGRSRRTKSNTGSPMEHSRATSASRPSLSRSDKTKGSVWRCTFFAIGAFGLFSISIYRVRE